MVYSVRRRRLIFFGSILLILTLIITSCTIIFFSRNGKQQPVNKPNASGNNGEDVPGQDNRLQILFDRKFSDFDIDIQQAKPALYWSPDDKYIVFEGLKRHSQGEIRSAVAVADIEHNTIIKIKDGGMVSAPSWSSDSKAVAISFADGLYIYYMENNTLKRVTEKTVYMPRFSPDSSKLLYHDNGICVYAPGEHTYKRITDRKYDSAPVWFSDNIRVFAFRDNGRSLGGLNGNEQVLCIIDTGNPGMYTDITRVKAGRFRDAKWLKDDSLLHVVAGKEGEQFEHIIDVGSNKVTNVGELPGGTGYAIHVSRPAEKVLKVRDEQVDIYNFEMKKLHSSEINFEPSVPSAKDRTGYKLLKDGKIVFIHTNRLENKSAVMIADPVQDLVVRITPYYDVSVPSVSCNGDRVALIIEGKELFIIDAMNATGEVVPAKLLSISNIGPDDLSAIFPGKVDVEWLYGGTAVNNFTVKLDSINRNEELKTTEFLMSGEVVNAVSESEEDNKIEIKYVVSGNSVRETILKGKHLPNKITDLEIIRSPLEQGNSWIQPVNINGEYKDMTALIEEVNEDSITGEMGIRILYSVPMEGMPGGIYKEKRYFRQGKGLEMFEATYNSNSNISYRLLRIAGTEE